MLFLLKLLNVHFYPTAVIPLPGITQEKRKLTPTKNKLIAGLLRRAKTGDIGSIPRRWHNAARPSVGHGTCHHLGRSQKPRHRGAHAPTPLTGNWGAGKTQPRRQTAKRPTRVGAPWGWEVLQILLAALRRLYTIGRNQNHTLKVH